VNPLRKPAVLLLVLALAFSGCGGDEDIAGVGDAVIRLSDIEGLFDGGAPSDDVFRDMLFSKIALEVLTRALAEQYEAAPGAGEAEEFASQLEEYLDQAGYTAADYLGVENASVKLLRLHAEVLAVQQAALEALLTDPEVVDGLFADVGLTNVCVKHVLVGTEDEAESVRARLEAGEDFATVAGQVSLDVSTPGGDLGCAPAGSYVAPFAEAALAAPIGELTGPVESEFGYHVLVVSERTTLTREEYLADPWSALGEAQLGEVWAAWMAEVLDQAEPWVAAEYGTWTPAGIDPPADGE
jgi:parvulin-like peptidyl-prolyl isomerase